MNATLLTLLTFCIALAIGIYIGKLLFKAKSQSEKIGLEEKLIGLNSQFKAIQEQLKTNQSEIFGNEILNKNKKLKSYKKNLPKNSKI
jgi:DNA recombination protein RmuC